MWRECYRVLDDGSRLCINIGDQFARTVYYGRYKVIPIRTEIIKFCECIGFDYMGAIIWQKKTTSNTTGGASLMGSYPYPKNGILSLDYEFILIFKKLGTPPKVSQELKEQSKLTKEEWKEYFQGHWYFGGAKQNGHMAMFPYELPKRLIKMFSFVGDTILDPFLGSGTTSLAAKDLHRNSVGYEINSDFIPLIEQKLQQKESTLFIDSDDIIIEQDHNGIDYEQEIASLPYIFKDNNPLHNKIDPKKLTFGSKIDKYTPTHKEDYYRIKEIISPTLIKLNDERTIRLIGIQEISELREQAIGFFRAKD